MAKKNDAYDKFLADVLAEVPEDKRSIVEESLKASKKLPEGVLAREDYSKNMDELKTQRQQFDGEVAEARNRINGWEKWYGDTSKEVSTVKEQLAAYEAEFGPLEGTKKGTKPTPSGLSKEDVQKEIQGAGNAYLKFSMDLNKIAIRHFKAFGEELDTDKLVELGAKENLPLGAAYDRMTADLVADKREKDLTERIKRERQEEREKVLAERGFPALTPDAGRPHALDLQPKVGKTETDRVNAAIEGFSSLMKH
jgi:hypothetical protein